jgi:hypothetical protein
MCDEVGEGSKRVVIVCLGGNVLGELKLPVVFPLKDCFCFYFDVFTEN